MQSSKAAGDSHPASIGIFRILLALAAVLLMAAAPAHAQYPTGGGMGGGMGGGGMGGGGMGRGAGVGRRAAGMRQGGGMMALPTPEELEGPPNASAVVEVLGLDPSDSARYESAYDAHMSATAPARDSLRSEMDSLRSSFRGGDREAGRVHARAAQRIWKNLSQQDDNFDKSLKSILTKDQFRQYRDWRKQEKKDAQDLRRQQMRERMGGGQGGPPPEGAPDSGPR
jgi:hypothetical protein